MKSAWERVAWIVTLVSICVSAFLIRENQTLRMLKDLNDQENRLLEADIEDLKWKITSSRTYEEGLADGILNRGSSDYVRGYHQAITQSAEMAKYLQVVDSEKIEEQSQP